MEEDEEGAFKYLLENLELKESLKKAQPVPFIVGKSKNGKNRPLLTCRKIYVFPQQIVLVFLDKKNNLCTNNHMYS